MTDDEGTIVSQASEPVRSRKSRGRWHAVAKGRRIGVFSSRRDLDKSIKGYPGAVWKRFHTEESAQAWLAERYGPEGADDDTISGNTWATRVEPFAGVPVEVGGDDCPSISLPIEQITDLTTIGPDTPVGKSKEIHGTSIQIEPEVLKLLCPKGVTAAVRRELIGTAVDVVSLPGKFSSTSNAAAAEGALIFDQFAEAVGDLTDVSARLVGAPPRDSQWRSQLLDEHENSNKENPRNREPGCIYTIEY
jgi:hypothetical protein